VTLSGCFSEKSRLIVGFPFVLTDILTMAGLL
jgi:hypothetical protein